jgi:hypothetical protein
MNASNNAFQYEAANNLPVETIIEVYVEDFNFSRFIQSKRNIFLVGERGSGKTMTLLYNSLPVQLAKHEKEGRGRPLDMIGVYIPCNTPLTHRKEYQLLPDIKASVVSEHFLVLAVIYNIAETLALVPETLNGVDQAKLRSEIEYLLGLRLRDAEGLYKDLRDWAQREIVATQRKINEQSSDASYSDCLSFAAGVMPLLGVIRCIPSLKDSHFLLMMDDAHDLNEHQSRSLNSWIAYRDHSYFSFKVATAKVGQPTFITTTGGSILEGHDFTTVDMEQPLQTATSDFGRMADRIIEKRLAKAGIQKSPSDFFPISPQLESDMRVCHDEVKRRITQQHSDWSPSRIQDYVYRFGRAEYFRRRSSKANRPAYSGFDTLVYLSTGVIRNLLEPCYQMYDAVQSRHSDEESGSTGVHSIPPEDQTDIIMKLSERFWSRLKDGLDRSIDGCSSKQAKQIATLFEKLATYFRHRLLNHESEPQANSFSITGLTDEIASDLMPLLEIARKAQMLYERIGPAKDRGLRERYYVPNRMLWPSIGLDLHGQHARASLKARDLLLAADGRDIPVKTEPGDNQMEMFHE